LSRLKAELQTQSNSLEPPVGRTPNLVDCRPDAVGVHCDNCQFYWRLIEIEVLLGLAMAKGNNSQKRETKKPKKEKPKPAPPASRRPA